MTSKNPSPDMCIYIFSVYMRIAMWDLTKQWVMMTRRRRLVYDPGFIFFFFLSLFGRGFDM